MLDPMYALGAAAGKMAKPTKQKKQGAPARAAAAQKQLRTGKAAAGKAAPAPTRQGAPARAAAASKANMSGGKPSPGTSMPSRKQNKGY